MGPLRSARQVRAGALVATRSVFPRAPDGVDLARGVNESVRVFFFFFFVGKGKERVGGPWRHVDATANLGPRRAHGFPPGAPGCDVFREVRPSPDGWGFSFEARVRFLKSGRWFSAAADTPVNTDDKSSAKWLLERIAEQGERWGRVKVT